MRNILNEKPNNRLIGRIRFTNGFVKQKDITNKKILDIGCGYGWFEIMALEKGGEEIVGIEISKEDLKSVKKHIHDKRTIFKVGSAIDIPSRENYFDTVVSWEVLEHIPQNTETNMFKEVNRVLRKGGVFYLSTPFNTFFSTVLDPAFWLTNHRHYSKEQLRLLGKTNGFEVQEMYVRGGWWTVINLWNMYISKWILRRRPLFEKYMLDQEDKQFLQKKNGFVGIFVKYIKL